MAKKDDAAARAARRRAFMEARRTHRVPRVSDSSASPARLGPSEPESGKWVETPRRTFSLIVEGPSAEALRDLIREIAATGLLTRNLLPSACFAFDVEARFYGSRGAEEALTLTIPSRSIITKVRAERRRIVRIILPDETDLIIEWERASGPPVFRVLNSTALWPSGQRAEPRPRGASPAVDGFRSID